MPHGHAYTVLGKITSNDTLLEEAVRTFRPILEVFTREAMPTDWAGTQSNLGVALQTLGQTALDSSKLEAAAAAYQAALEVYTREAMPEAWAMTQSNLDATLASIGQINVDTIQLERAFELLSEVQFHTKLTGQSSNISIEDMIESVSLRIQKMEAEVDD